MDTRQERTNTNLTFFYRIGCRLLWCTWKLKTNCHTKLQYSNLNSLSAVCQRRFFFFFFFYMSNAYCNGIQFIQLSPHASEPDWKIKTHIDATVSTITCDRSEWRTYEDRLHMCAAGKRKSCGLLAEAAVHHRIEVARGPRHPSSRRPDTDSWKASLEAKFLELREMDLFPLQVISDAAFRGRQKPSVRRRGDMLRCRTMDSIWLHGLIICLESSGFFSTLSLGAGFTKMALTTSQTISTGFCKSKSRTPLS